MRRKREPWLHPVSGQHESNPAGTPAVTFHLLQKSRSEIENGKDDEGRNVWGKSSSQMSSRSVKTCLILESCVISFPLCLSLVTVNCLLKRECQKNLVYKKKKKKGTFSEMLDNSRGIVLRNLSHTLLKKKTKNTMTEFTSSRELYYPKHSWSNSLHLLWTLYFPPHASSNWTRAHRSTVTAQTELQGRKQAGVREPWENNQCWQKHESKHRVVCRHHRCFEREMWY